MSGIVCVLHLDHSPVDPQLIRKLTAFQRFRGPDAEQVWLGDFIGLGHTLLETTDDTEPERQPFSLDGMIWITADARIDGRKELVGKLEANGSRCASRAGVTDAELILRAYATWGEDCVDHLLGDFAFAIWDSVRQRLFCARDHMGIKPLFYAQIGSTVVVSNTLDCVRQHLAVTDSLNEQVVGDFLMYEIVQDTAATFFSDIHRLPGGHSVSWDSAGMHKRRYWTLPIDEPLNYRRNQDYVDRFRELLGQAVADRLRCRRLAVHMSGGRDSTTITATAHALLTAEKEPFTLQAFTMLDPTIMEEKHYAAMVAGKLGIPVDFTERKDNWVDFDWEERPLHTPEPEAALPFLREYHKHHLRIASFAKVALEGEGPDNALTYEWLRYLSYIFHKRQYGRWIRGLLSDQIARPRVPFLGRITRKTAELLANEPETPFPQWIHPDFIARADLHQRWRQFWAGRPPRHPVRPAAYESLVDPLFQAFPEVYDASRTKAPLEVRHPFLDIRLLRYMLAVPVIPWCRSKYLVQRAMQGVLPQEIFRRPKATLPCVVTVRQLARKVRIHGPFAPEFNRFVDPGRLPTALSSDIGDFNNSVRGRILNHWLQNAFRIGRIV